MTYPSPEEELINGQRDVGEVLYIMLEDLDVAPDYAIPGWENRSETERDKFHAIALQLSRIMVRDSLPEPERSLTGSYLLDLSARPEPIDCPECDRRGVQMQGGDLVDCSRCGGWGVLNPEELGWKE